MVHAVCRMKISKSRLGQQHSEETRQKMRIAKKRYWENRQQEAMQSIEPSPSAEAPHLELEAQPSHRATRPKRKAWNRQATDSTTAEE